ncbi:MAG: peptidylprolyl isomerase [Kofleriaceae bacterium]
MQLRSILLLAALVGCEHKSPKDDQVDLPSQPSPDPSPAARAKANGSGSAGSAAVASMTGSAGSGSDATVGSAGSGSAVAEATPPPSNEDVRPPVAADLETYTKDLKGKGKLQATIETNQGTIHCDLFGDKSPITVANFVGLARGLKPYIGADGKKSNKPFFDGLTFHRVIPGFMIQGGDPQGSGMGGPGYQFVNEQAQGEAMTAGTLAMANAGRDTNGSQFFICEVDRTELDPNYTIFGRCKETDIVKKITGVPRNSSDKPNDAVVMKKVTISRAP